MSDPAGKKWAGICMLCGADRWVDPHVTRVEQAPEVFLSGTNTHNCEHGRILRTYGSEAYEMWVDAQPPGSHISMDELVAELEKFESERGR